MPSPFPGMDPYLEEPSGWSSVHLSLIVAIQAELNRVLPEAYVARIDEYVWVRDTAEGNDRLLTRPDVYIPEPRRPGSGTVTLSRSSAAPTTRGTLPNKEKRVQRYVQVATARGRNVLTAIEILSPSIKNTGEDRDAYLQKRRGHLGSVNFVEIDLLREGRRFPTGRPVPPPSDYRVFMCRHDEFPDTETWAINLRDKLPLISITHEIPSASLDLRAALNRVYHEGCYYADEVDCSLPPVPPLRSLDADWAADLLKKAARKRKK